MGLPVAACVDTSGVRFPGISYDFPHDEPNATHVRQVLSQDELKAISRDVKWRIRISIIFGSWIRIRIRVKSWIRIRIKVKIQKL
jgi:hypothetical protein